MTIFDAFQRIYVINLPSRADRRRAVLAELARAGIAANDPRLRIFPGVRPDEAGGFPTVGTRGCYLSHLGIVREAVADGLDNVLILEDDLALAPLAFVPQPGLLAELAQGDWDFAYSGHVEAGGDPNGPPVWETTQAALVCAHFYALNRRVLGPLRDYLEACLERPPGHPEGGPMHVDGAFAMFRRQNPELVTLICKPSLGGQRSSRSDIHANRWYDRLPGFRQAAGLARALLNALRGLRRGGAGTKQA